MKYDGCTNLTIFVFLLEKGRRGIAAFSKEFTTPPRTIQCALGGGGVLCVWS